MIRCKWITALVLLLAGAGAQAELINLGSGAYRDLQFVKGASIESSSFEVSGDAVGISVTLTDLAFPTAFDELAVAITDAAASFFSTQLTLGADGAMGNTVSMAFTLDSPGTYVASVYAMLGGQGANAPIGLYELEIAEIVGVIPVPPAAVLFLSGLIAVGLRQRRQR